MIAPEIPADEKERLAALLSIDVLDTPDEERYDRIVRLTGEIFQVPIAYVSFVDANRQWLKSQVGMPTCETSREISFCGHTILKNEPLIIPDAALDVRFADNPMVTGEPRIRFYAGVPLRSPDGFNIGTLCIADRRPRKMTTEQVTLLGDLAGLVERELTLVEVIEAQRKLLEVQTALADSRAHLADELGKAAGYVRSLLPKGGAIPDRVCERLGVDFRHLPSAQLGGDILDYFALPDGRLAIYLLDVSGHGVGSALLSVSVMNVLRARALPDTDFGAPEQVLDGLNRTFRMTDHDNKYFTMWYGIFDPVNGELTYAVGGHPPGLVLCETSGGCRTVEQLPGRGLIVGALPEACYEPVRRTMAPPCELWVFSDGAYEIFPPGDETGDQMLGLAGFTRLLAELPQEGCAEYEECALDTLIAQLREFGGGQPFEDDVTLLRIRFH